MNKLTKVTIATGVFLSVTASVMPAFASYEGCMARNLDPIGCWLSEKLGGEYITPPRGGSSSKVKARIKDAQAKGLMSTSSNKSARKNKNKYAPRCSASNIVSMIEKKTSPKRIVSACYVKTGGMKPGKAKAGMHLKLEGIEGEVKEKTFATKK